MATACKDVCSRFFDLMEEDEDFFDGYDLSETARTNLIYERAMNFLHETCAYLKRHCSLPVELTVITLAEEQAMEAYISSDLTEEEINLLALGMQWRCYERKIAKLGPVINALSASEMKYAASPNQERSTYLALARRIKEDFDIEVSHYAGRDRITGAVKTISYSLPEESYDDE